MTSNWSERTELLKDFGTNKTNVYTCENIRRFLDKHLPPNILEHVNDKIFIYYYEVMSTGVYQTCKSRFANRADLIETVIRSSSIPFVTTSLSQCKNFFDAAIVPFIKCPFGSTLVVSKPEYFSVSMFIWNHDKWQEVVLS